MNGDALEHERGETDVGVVAVRAGSGGRAGQRVGGEAGADAMPREGDRDERAGGRDGARAERAEVGGDGRGREGARGSGVAGEEGVDVLLRALEVLEEEGEPRGSAGEDARHDGVPGALAGGEEASTVARGP